MKTQSIPQRPIVHAAFVDALSGEFIARTGCGVYVYLNPADVYRLFHEFQSNAAPIRAYVRQVVKAIIAEALA